MEVFPDSNAEQTKDKLDEIEKRKATGRIYERIFVRHWDTWKDGSRKSKDTYENVNERLTVYQAASLLSVPGVISLLDEA